MGKAIWVGVDVGKSECVAAVAVRVERADGQALRQLPVASFAHDRVGVAALVTWVQQVCGASCVDGIVVESTGRFSAQWCALLGKRLGPVAVINPRQARDYGRSLGVRDKTDALDARVLALYGASVQPAPTVARSAVRQRLCELNRLFTTYSVDRQAYAQRLGEYGDDKILARELRKTIASLERQMKKLQKAMDTIIEHEPELARDVEFLVSIPGVGRRTAYVLLAELGDLRTYTRNQLAARVGVYPRQKQSGTSVRGRPRMVRGAGAPVRKVLYLCAMAARKHNPQLAHVYERLLANGKTKMSALGTLMRRLLLQARAILKSNQPYDPKHA